MFNEPTTRIRQTSQRGTRFRCQRQLGLPQWELYGQSKVENIRPVRRKARETKRGRDTNRRTNRQAGGQTNRQTGRQRERTYI